MTVSVVVPAWNAAVTLDDTLRSLVAQSYPSWEAIVVDDGSTDTTGAIAEAWAARDGRIRVVHQPNGGEAAARNRGVAEAQADWLLFLDADDWIDSRHLEAMTARLAAVPEADAVLCGYARVTASGLVLPEAYRAPEGDLFPTLARRAAFAVHACVVRKALVEAVGGFDDSFQTSPDWDLWQRVARTGARFVGVPDMLAFYRMTPGSASRNACQLFADGLRVIENGCRPDPRVTAPDPEHAAGVAEPPATQAYYLLAWCAGLLLGTGRDPAVLFPLATCGPFPQLYPPAIAECLFDAVPQAMCEGPGVWERIHEALVPAIQQFLDELAFASGAEGLASAATSGLRLMVLERSAVWPLIAVTLDELRVARETLERTADEWRLRADAREQELDQERQGRLRLETQLGAQEGDLARLREARAALDSQLAARTAERDALKWSGDTSLATPSSTV